MSLEIIWGPKYYRSDTTKRWSIRAKVIENEKERDYRKTGFQNKKEAKLVWLNYLAENQDESTGMTDKRVVSLNQRKSKTKTARRTVTHL